MNLQQIFANREDLVQGLPPIEISLVTQDTRQIVPNSMYVAIHGEKKDGHDYIAEAIEKGAIAVVVEEKSKVPKSFSGTVIVVKNSREILEHIAGNFYENPGRELFCVGVTGTNGKTSITYLVESIFNYVQKTTGVIGTINHHCGEKIWPTEMTTPDPLFLQKRLREFCDLGAKVAALEVSSHALTQYRVESVPFDCVVFTNLTRDHLDYHHSMKNYFAAKQRLFTDLLWKTGKNPCWAIVNSDDNYGLRLKIAEVAELLTYGRKNCDLQFRDEVFDYGKTKYHAVTPAGEIDIEIKMSGLHNIYNSLAAIAVGIAANISLEQIAEALKKFSGVPGRMQFIENKRKFSTIVDYAHTPDALENTLHSLNDIRRKKTAGSRSAKGDASSSHAAGSRNSNTGKIWCVFGCGGDRDPGKRPLMAEIAARLSDQVVLTSDNPRTEDPLKIIQDIQKGFSPEDLKKVKIEPDRQRAIEMAMTLAEDEDVILVAGKGHEDYQIIGDKKIHFSDAEIIQNFFKNPVS